MQELSEAVDRVDEGGMASEFNLGELHSSMKGDVGFSIRAYAEGAIGRVGFAFSEESWAATAMIGHPF